MYERWDDSEAGRRSPYDSVFGRGICDGCFAGIRRDALLWCHLAPGNLLARIRRYLVRDCSTGGSGFLGPAGRSCVHLATKGFTSPISARCWAVLSGIRRMG